MMDRAFWYSTTIGPSTWSYYFADPDDIESVCTGLPAEGVQYEGCCIKTESIILISRKVPRDRIPDVVVHESMHAVSAVACAHETLRISATREEAIVSTFAPGLTQALLSAKLLRLPRIPKGAR